MVFLLALEKMADNPRLPLLPGRNAKHLIWTSSAVNRMSLLTGVLSGPLVILAENLLRGIR